MTIRFGSGTASPRARSTSPASPTANDVAGTPVGHVIDVTRHAVKPSVFGHNRYGLRSRGFGFNRLSGSTSIKVVVTSG